MPLACDVLVDPGIDFVSHDELQALLERASVAIPEMPAGDWTVAVRVTGDAKIAELHARYFNDPSTTDVISFPSGDELSSHEGHLGDIAISYDTAAGQAVDGAHSVNREVAFLALHGLLHLLGYEDTTQAQRAVMLDLQAQLLATFDASFQPSWRA
jgi:probable rRNA maturation factor